MATLIFKNAEDAKEAIMASQKKEIAQLYEDWADEIGERAKFYSHKSTASAPVSERYYRELQKQLRATSQEVSNEIYKKIKTNIYTVSDAVVKDNVDWLKSFGFSVDGLNAAFSFVPNETVQRLVTGQIYEGGWNLSSRIWGDNEQTLKDIYQVMAKGLAENKPIYDIAKDLEKYVRPSANLPWNLRMEDGKKIYKKQVDYNAQRLARTLVQHGYQQSFIATTQKNPFITQYRWIANGSRVCELCQSRDGQLYDKDKLPMDHPNGMCVMEPVVADDITDQLADWFNSPDGTYPEIDAFAGNFGYEASKIEGKRYKRDIEAFDSLFSKHTQIYNSLSRDEQNAIKKYMSFAGVDENYKNKHLIDEAIKKAELTDDIILRRGVKDLPDNISDAMSFIGSEIRSSIKGKPISTTISSTTNFNNVTIEIKASKGTPGMFVDVARQSKQAEAARRKARINGTLAGESEFLLPSDTIIKIVGVRIDEKTKRIIYDAILM